MNHVGNYYCTRHRINTSALMALYKHWCAQGTIDSTQMIYRHILRRSRHTRNYTHIKLCSKHKKSTQVRSHGTAKLHKYALKVQWKTTHLCSWSTVEYYIHTGALMAQHCTQNHRYLAGLLMMRPYLVRTGVAVDTEDCAGTGVDVCRLRR